MKICVLGVGRSGTTAMYTLLQRLMEGIEGEVDYVYEPFLWDREALNLHWSRIGGVFDNIGALSAEGMLNHQRLPLFVPEGAALEGPEVEWLGGLLAPTGGRTHLLAKMIRACGRIELLRRLAPDLRIVFILRNPLDTVNSILSRFSFFGTMYHRDDFPRFLAEARELYGPQAVVSADAGRAEREASYWSVANRAALAALGRSAPDAVLFSYEQFVADRPAAVRRLCAAMSLPWNEEAVALSAEPVGSVTGRVDLTADEVERLRPLQAEYLGLLEEYGVPCTVDWGVVLARFRQALPAERTDDGLVGRVPAYLIGRARMADRRFQEMDERRRRAEQDLARSQAVCRRLSAVEERLQGEIERLQKRVAEIEEIRREQRRELGETREKLQECRRELRALGESHHRLEREVKRYRGLLYVKVHDAIRERLGRRKD